MKNFGKLTLGVLLAGTIGLTSCVDDQISNEVKAIYQNHASLISAQASLKQAEADLKGAELAYQLLLNQNQESLNTVQAALHQLQLQNAQNALELANQKHIAALLKLTAEVKATKSIEAEKYLGKFLAEKGTIIGLQSDLTAQNRNLLALNSSVTDGVFDKEEAIELKGLEIAKLESDLTKDEAKLVLLEAVLSDPTTTGAKVLDLQKQVDAIKVENKNREARIKEIRDTELSGYTSNMSDYQTAKTDLETAQKNIESSKVTLAGANEDLTEAKTKLGDLTNGVVISYANALSAKTAAKTVNDEKIEAYDVIDNLSANYSLLITEITTVDVKIEAAERNIVSITSNSTILKANYNSSKTIFDADPSGNTVTSVGVDGKAGNANDTSTKTYYEVVAVGTQVVYGTTAYNSFGDLPNGSVEGNGVGEFFNVEADDIVRTNKDVFTDAQEAFVSSQVNLSKAKADLDKLQVELAELKKKEAEFDGTLGAQLDAARVERDNAVDAYMLASNVVTQLEAITGLENTILTEEQELTKTEQKLTTAKSEVTRLEALVDTTKLSEYAALLDKIDALSLENKLGQDTIDNLQGDIIYLNGIELELEANNYSGADYKERMEKVSAQIKSQKEAVLATKKSLDLAKNNLEKIKQEKLNLEDLRKADIAKVEAEIAKLESEIAEREKLAETYKALMESVLA